jgi:transposase
LLFPLCSLLYKKEVQVRQRKSLQIVHPDAAGLDIGSREIFAAIPSDRAPETVESFGTYTPDLHALRDWLKEHGITTCAMESTGVYWIPVYDLLSASGFEVHLVNPRAIKQVPGRKSDVSDCQWLQELHSLGLLRGAFRPSEEAIEVRELVRQRQRLITDSARQVLHMQKALLQMNLQLPQVVSDISGETGLAIIGAILAGERDPQVLASLRNGHCKHDEATIAKALIGTWRKEHLFSLKQSHTLYQAYQKLILEVEKEIVASVESRFPNFERDASNKIEGPGVGKKSIRKRGDYSTPIQGLWETKVGVDLTQMEGISATTASVVLSEVGLCITRFKSAKHLASWAGLSPQNEISGGAVIRQGNRQPNRVGHAMRKAAWTLKNSKGPLGSYYRSMVLKKGTPRAIEITAHKMLRIIYAMLTKGWAYAKNIMDDMIVRQGEKKVIYLKRQARKMGMQLVPVET